MMNEDKYRETVVILLDIQIINLLGCVFLILLLTKKIGLPKEDISIGGSRGGAPGGPPKGPNSFVLTYKIFKT